MSCDDRECLTKGKSIELVLKLQRPAKTSRTSFKPHSTDCKKRREQSRPGGAKPGHEGRGRVIAEDSDTVVDCRRMACPDSGLTLSPDLLTEPVSVHERIELPEVKPSSSRTGTSPWCAQNAGTASQRSRASRKRGQIITRVRAYYVHGLDGFVLPTPLSRPRHATPDGATRALAPKA